MQQAAPIFFLLDPKIYCSFDKHVPMNAKWCAGGEQNDAQKIISQKKNLKKITYDVIET